MTIPLVEDCNAKFGEDVNLLPSTTPEEERRIIGHLMSEAQLHIAEGNLYHVISSRWFSKWENYVGLSISHPMRQTDSRDADLVSASGRPGPIDNSDIIDDDCGGKEESLDISRTLLERRDYVLVPREVWERLFLWYKGGPPLPRKVISQGIFNKRELVIEVYPLRLRLIDSRDNSETTLRLSKKDTIKELYDKVCCLKEIEKLNFSLWDYFNKRRHKELDLTSANKTLQDADLQMNQEILLELRPDGPSTINTGKDSTGNELALVAMEPSRSSMSIAGGPILSNGHSSNYSFPISTLNSTFSDFDNGFGSYNEPKRVENGGLAGLQNMGNTCFMNSALQCLVHTPPLVEYFLQDYTDEINAENPLGMHGELALAFGELLRKLWSAGRTAIAPRAFKGKLSQFAPQFSGYNQHDSQELLAFLLDGLHEDLNRVKRKPYMEMKDWSSHPDDEVAEECWRYHKARNDSVIVDVCQGQYKSTLVCPVCEKISITFDPFMYLSLPLPSSITRSMTITVFSGEGNGLPMPYTVSVTKYGNCRDLCHALSTACCLRNDELLLLAEVYDQKIYRWLEGSLDPLTSIKDEDHIVAYRLPEKASGKVKLEIVHKEQREIESVKTSSWKFFGTPLITYLESDNPSGADIDDAVSKLLSPLRRASSATFYNGKESGFKSIGTPNEESADTGNDQCEQSDVSMEDVEDQDTPSTELLFQLSLTDDRYTGNKLIFKDSVIKSGNRVRVVLEWTEREHKLYDASYLKDLPVVFHKTGFSSKKTKQESISLFSCLEAFLREEPLGPNDMWYCPGCKEHRQASKKLDLWMLPEILVFHLKRFSFSRFFKNKLDTYVDFPIHNLELSKYVKKKGPHPYTYELYAVSCHYGGLGGGHYTAFAKLIDEDKWYNFDDSRVSPALESEIKSSAAYVLFYRRVKAESNEAGNP